jgi:hypothetical protein
LLQSAGVDAATSGALGIGNGSTATSVSICNSANCDSVSIATNNDADTINIGDASDTINIAGSVSVTNQTKDLIKVQHNDGTATYYQSASDSDASRGAELMTAIGAAVDGDTLYLSTGTFDIGNNYLDLSIGGTGTISLRGAGKYSTTIQSTKVGSGGSGHPIVVAGSDSVTADVSIIGTLTDGSIQLPWGVGANDTAATNAALQDAYLFAWSDGLYIQKNGTSATIRNVTASTKWDAAYIRGSSVSVDIYDSTFTTVADSNINSGQLTHAIVVFGSGETVRCFNCSFSASNASSENDGVYNTGGTITMYGGSIATADTSPYDVNNSGTTNLYSVDFDPSKVTNSGTINAPLYGTSAMVQGDTTIQTTTNSATAFQVQNAIGSTAISVDTTANSAVVPIMNPDFEGTDTLTNYFWGQTFGTTISKDTSQYYKGKSSLKVITGTSGDDAATVRTGNSFNPTTLALNTTYTISWYDKLDSGSAAFTDVEAYYARDGATPVSPCTNYNTQTVVTTGWTRHTCQITTDGTAAAFLSFIAIGQSGTTSHTFYIDNVQIEATSTASIYRDTAISLDGVIVSPISIKNATDSTTAFQLQDANDNTLLLVDTLGGNISLAPAETGDLVINTDSDSNVQITASAAPSTDIVSISNSGNAAATDGVAGLAINFTGSNESSDAIHITPSYSGNGSDTFNVLNIDPFTASTSSGSDTIRGINVGVLTESGAGIVNSFGINVDGGWDRGIRLNNNAVGIELNNASGGNGINLTLGGGNGIVFSGPVTTGKFGYDFGNSQINTVSGTGIRMAGIDGGVGLDLASNQKQNGTLSGTYLQINPTTTFDIGGLQLAQTVFIDANYNYTADATDLQISGTQVNITGNCTTTGGGTCTDSSTKLALSQNYSGATGILLDGTNAGTGDLIHLSATGTGTTPNAIQIAQTSSGVITNAIDVSDAEIVNAIDVGGNTVTGSGYLITSTASGLTVNSTSADLILQTTTSGDVVINPAGNFVLPDLAGSNAVLYAVPTTGIVTTATTSTGSQCLVSGAGGTGTPSWGSCGGGSASFSSITAGTNTNALVIGNGGSLTTSGTGTITATTAAALQTSRTIGGVSFDGTANITVASATGGFAVSGGNLTVTAQNASAFTVGRQGATSPAFQVDSSISNSVTGLKVTAGIAGGGLTLAEVGGNTDESLTISAKGAGTVTLAGTSTGAIQFFSSSNKITSAGALTIAGALSTTDIVCGSTSCISGSEVTTDTIDWTDIADTSTLDDPTTIAFNASSNGTGLDLNFTNTSSQTAVTGFEITPTITLDAADLTAIGLNINPNTNSNNDSGDVLIGLQIANITGTVGTENAINIGSGWDSGIMIGNTGYVGLDIGDTQNGIILEGSSYTNGIQIGDSTTGIIISGSTTGILVSGATDILSGDTNGDLTLSANGAGNVVIFGDSNTGLKISGATTDILTAATEDLTVLPGGNLLLSDGDGTGATYVIRFGDATNNMVLGSGFEPVLAGSARHTRKVTLVPEYPGAVMTADGGSNTGTMTSDYDSTNRHNYYQWVTTSQNDYDVWVRWQVPSDFSDFISSNPISMYGWRTDSTTTTQVTLTLLNASGSQCSGGSSTNVATGTATWTSTNLGGTLTSANCSISAGDVVIFQIHMDANNKTTRAGELTINYLSKW